MRLIGKWMQLAALGILPIAIGLQLIFDDPHANTSELERPGQEVFGLSLIHI